MIVPGGGISLDGRRWISRRPDFFLPVRVLSALFRRLMLQKLAAAHAAGQLNFYGADAGLAERRAFMRRLGPLRRRKAAEAKSPERSRQHLAQLPADSFFSDLRARRCRRMSLAAVA